MTATVIRPSVVIMSDPRRAEFIPHLLASLDAPATVVYDACDCEHGKPTCPIAGHRDRWATGSRALLAGLADPHATHIVCLQDDSIVCRDFVAGAIRALEVVPDQPVSFYAGKPRPQDTRVSRLIAQAKAAGRSWMRFEGPWWGVCVALPLPLIRPAVAAANLYPKIQNYDVRLARGLMKLGYQCCYTLPSLVDHRQGHVSLIPGGRPQGRRAHWFIGKDKSALDVEWTPLDSPSAAYMQVRVGGKVAYKCVACEFRTPAKYQIMRHVGSRHPTLVGAR